jgi:hypothetical protein
VLSKPGSLRAITVALGGLALLSSCTMPNPAYERGDWADAGSGRDAVPGGGGDAGAAVGRDADVAGASSLVGWWKLDETGGRKAADSSGFGNDGTLDSSLDPAAAWVGDGQSEGALSLPVGGKGGVQIPVSGSLAGLHQITVAAWMKRASASSAIEIQHVIASQQDDSDAKAETFGLEAFREDLEAFITTNPAAQTSGSGLLGVRVTGAGTREMWTHVAMTYDGVSLRLFRNGRDVGSETITRPFVPSSKPLYIGLNKNGASDQAFEGEIDDVVIYAKALPATAIMALATGTSPSSF